MIYEDADDLKRRLIELFERGFDLNKVRKFLRNRDAKHIARKFIDLLNSLLGV